MVTLSTHLYGHVIITDTTVWCCKITIHFLIKKKKSIYVGAKGTQINYTHESTEVEEGRGVELAMGWSVLKTSTMNSENK